MSSLKIENKYLRVLVAAQRSKQLRNGARPLVRMAGYRATRIALEETGQGLIGFDFTPADVHPAGDRNSRAEIAGHAREDERGVEEPLSTTKPGD